VFIQQTVSESRELSGDCRAASEPVCVKHKRLPPRAENQTNGPYQELVHSTALHNMLHKIRFCLLQVRMTVQH